jgi:hypothetical protein
MAREQARARDGRPRGGAGARRRPSRSFEGLESRVLLSGDDAGRLLLLPPALTASLGTSDSTPLASLPPDLGLVGKAVGDATLTSPAPFPGLAGSTPAATDPPPATSGAAAPVGPVAGPPAPAATLGWLIQKLEVDDADGGDSPRLFETVDPHGRPDNAQELPALDRMQVLGHLSPEDRYDLYRILLANGADSVRLAVHLFTPGPAGDERLVLLDDQGEVLDDRPFDPNAPEVSLMLHAPPSGGLRSVLVGIYRASNVGAAPTAGAGDGAGDGFSNDGVGTTYAIDITEMTGSKGSGPLSGSATESTTVLTPMPAGGAVVTPAAAGVPVSTSTATPATTGLSSATTPVLVVAGPGAGPDVAIRAPRASALRSAAPEGGRLAVGPPTRVLDRRDAANLDLDLAQVPGADRPNAGDPEGLEDFGLPSEPLRAPGGLTLLSPVLPAGAPAGLAAQTTRARPKLPGLSAQSAPLADPPCLAPGSPDSSSNSSSWWPRVEPRDLVRVGLGLAYVVTFTLLLPDLARAFQLAPGRPRRRLRLGVLRRLASLARRPLGGPIPITPRDR